MRFNRAKNAGRNIIFGMILKIYQLIMPFIIRTVIIYCLGVNYLGLSSLFTSVLQVLNLAELGVGSAMIYSMYRPIVEDDTQKICCLLSLYKKYYRIIGLIVGGMGVIILPFIKVFVKQDIPAGINIYFLFFLNLISTVLSYFLFAYKSSVLLAHQRNDIISKITIVTNTFQYIFQIFIILFLKDFYLYYFTFIIFQVLNNILSAFAASKYYPQYKPYGTLAKSEVKEINQRVKDLFSARLGLVIVSSADTIVISSFLGLSILAIYQNYYFILDSVYKLIGVIFTSVTAVIGNCLLTDSKEKNYKDFEVFNFIIEIIISVSCCCFIGLYQPFMSLWVGKKLMLPYSYVILFCLYYYVLQISMVWATEKDASGMWHEDRLRPLIGALFNLVLNLILVKIIGLYGVIISTILSYILISMPWLIINLFKVVFKKKANRFILHLILEFLLICICCFICYLFCEKIATNSVLNLIYRAIVCISLPLIFHLAFYLKSGKFRYIRILFLKTLSGECDK